VTRATRPPKKTLEQDADRIPVKVNYDRVIRDNWSNAGEDAWNLKMEVADCRSRPELLEGRSDEGFLRILESKAIRRELDGTFTVWLSPMEQRRIKRITSRFVDPGYAAAWRKTRAERAAAATASTATAIAASSATVN
jgi:hypothetical protein